MSRKGKTLLASFFIFAAVILCARAAAKPQKALKVDVDLVMVNVTVTGPNNEIITDLTQEHFQLFEDKIQQEIRYFSTDTAPLSLGIVFDMSHSMQNKIDLARQAAVTFLENGTPEDEYFLVEFAGRANLAEDFTSDISRLRNRLAFTPASGTTALYDAVYLGLSKLKSGQNPKRALLLITDGEDNHSRYSRSDIREFVRESDAQIYVIDLGRALIGHLAEMTGGRSYRGSVEDLQDICEKIAQELKSQYVLGYESTNTNRDGDWRDVRVRITPPRGMPKLNLRAKNGYYAPAS